MKLLDEPRFPVVDGTPSFSRTGGCGLRGRRGGALSSS